MTFQTVQAKEPTDKWAKQDGYKYRLSRQENSRTVHHETRPDDNRTSVKAFVHI